MAKMKLETFLEQGEVFHILRNRQSSGFPVNPEPHGHDFAEVMWVEQGCYEHWVNGKLSEIGMGDMIFIRPRDQHWIKPLGLDEHRFTNIAIGMELYKKIAESETYKKLQVWHNPTESPTLYHCQKWQLRELANMADKLMVDSKDQMMSEWFLLDLLRIIRSDKGRQKECQGPQWLAQAISELNDPNIYRKGAKGFAAVCHRSLEHVSRVCKKHLNKTPSQLVNEARLDAGANALRHEDINIATLALDLGFQSLAHFYSLFQQYYGVPPAKYRRQQRLIISGHSS